MRKRFTVIITLAFLASAIGIIFALHTFVVAAEPTEVITKRTETSKTYSLGGNRYALDASIGAIHYRAPWKGIAEWTDIAPKFRPTGVSEWASEGAEYDVWAAEDLTAGQVVRWCVDAACVALQPMALSWTNSLNQIQQIAMPQADATFSQSERAVSWTDAYGKGTTLTWQLDNTRLSKLLTIEPGALPKLETYIIAGGNAALELSFIFAPSADLKVVIGGAQWDAKTLASSAAGQSVAFVNARGDTVFAFGAPIAWDSVGNEAAGTMRFKASGNKMYVSVRVPYTWLQTATGTVTIDPTLELQVGAYTDDAVQDQSTRVINVYIATANLGYSDQTQGFRFTNITIDKDTVPTTAYLVVTASANNSTGTPSLDMYCDDVDDSVTFDPAPPGPDDRTRTTNTTNWDLSGAFVAESTYNSSELGGVSGPLTEVLARASWASGNAVSVIGRPNPSNGYDYRPAYTYDGSTTKCPKLHIEYGGGGEPTPTPFMWGYILMLIAPGALALCPAARGWDYVGLTD